jgi:hypothetical protein
MRIGKVAKAMVSKVVTGKMDTSKPAGGKVEFGYAPKGRKGKKA